MNLHTLYTLKFNMWWIGYTVHCRSSSKNENSQGQNQRFVTTSAPLPKNQPGYQRTEIDEALVAPGNKIDRKKTTGMQLLYDDEEKKTDTNT